MIGLFSGIRFANAFAIWTSGISLPEVAGLHVQDHGWLKALKKLELTHGIVPRTSRRLMLLLLSSDMKPPRRCST